MKNEKTASRIREALDKKGMRAQELANRTGIDKSSISQYVHGLHKPSPETATRMADVLGVDPMWLMGHDVIEAQTDYYKELQKYMNKLNDKGKEQVSKYIIFIASQEEFNDD